MDHMDKLPPEFLVAIENGEKQEIVVCDYVGAMSDRFAISLYEDLYIPKSWHI
jgi:dGTPase